MKKTRIIYWIITGVFAAFMAFSAIPDLLVQPDAVKLISTQLGYPQYIISFLGAAKIVAAIVILIPGFPRIKEWAYAGLFFDLLGATYSIVATKPSDPQWMFMLIFFVFLFASYFYYHKMLKEKANLAKA